MKKYTVEEIFTPVIPAIHTYIHRKNIDMRIDRALRTIGKQIIVYGHSGAGKTTLLTNKFSEKRLKFIKTQCVSGMTISNLIIDAFNGLNSYYVSQQHKKESAGLKSELSASYLGIKASLGSNIDGVTDTSLKRVVDLPITPQTLAHYIGKSGYIWVIEDFHKLDENSKTQMAQIMKVFMDCAPSYKKLRIIAIGAVNSAREVVQYDKEMNNRVAEIEVPLMDDNNLRKILDVGEKLLNIEIPEKIKQSIISYSNGLPSVTHNLAQLFCDTNEISETIRGFFPKKLDSKLFDLALTEYVEENSDTLKSQFEIAIRLTELRKVDNATNILRAIIDTGKDGATLQEVEQKLKFINDRYLSTNLKKYLDELLSIERCEILRYNRDSMKYYFSSPLTKAYCQCLFRSLVNDKITSKMLLSELSSILDRELELARKVFLEELPDDFD